MLGEETGILGRVIAGISAQTMRVTGAVIVLLALAVIGVSLGTDYGLAINGTAADGTTTGDATATATNSGIGLSTVVEFTLAHPAYPVAIVVGFVFLTLGENVPLLGD